MAQTVELLSWRTWWRHQMETFSALLAICAGNSPVTGEFLTQRPVTRSFDVFFALCLNKRLNKQSWGWWFETPSCPLWRHCNETRNSLFYMDKALPCLFWFQSDPLAAFYVFSERSQSLRSEKSKKATRGSDSNRIMPYLRSDAETSVSIAMIFTLFLLNIPVSAPKVSQPLTPCPSFS